MAPIANHVNPGDLILASLINSILDKISSIDDRLSALENGGVSTGAAIITGLLPSGPIQVGKTLTVSGRNFGFSVGAQQVFIDTVQVNSFQAGSSDQQLIFNIPTTITDVPAQGRTATLSISNGILPAAKQTISLLPAFTLTGAVEVNYVGPTTGAVTAGQPTTLQFTIKSGASLDATFTIQPVVTGALNAAAFNQNLQILDDTKAVNAAGTVHLFAGQQKTFYVSINPVPVGSTGSFEITVNAGSGNVTGSSGSLTLSMGQIPPTPDTTITMNFSSAVVLPATGGSVSNSQVQLQSTAQAKITIQAVFTVAASYDLTSTVVSGSNWSATLFGETTSTPVVITAADLNNASKSANRLLDFIIAPSAGASATGQVQITAQNHGQASSRVYSMDLALTS